ncbi:MAG: hypothetical protein C4294_12700 [Nitrospiraceae bacterium]
MQAFIVKSKGEKKKVIADIIGFDAVIDFRNALGTSLNKLEKDPELALAKKTLEKNRGILMTLFNKLCSN